MLVDKSIVITGAGRGIGRASARLAAELGASIIVNDIDAAAAEGVAAEIRASGGTAIADGTDISSWAGAEQLVGKAVRHFGGLHGLVNNAAVFVPGVFEALEEADWRRAIEVNVLGSAFLMTHAVRQMLPGGGGAVVNVISGSHQGAPDMAPYSTSKGAVASMIYAAAIDLGPRGVRVNGVSPVAATVMEEQASAFGETVGRAPMMPSLTPEENATAICFLLSDDSRDFNGQILRIERDGLSMLGHPTVLLPYPRLKTDSYPAVRDAAVAELGSMLQPLGIRYGRLEHQ